MQRLFFRIINRINSGTKPTGYSILYHSATDVPIASGQPVCSTKLVPTVQRSVPRRICHPHGRISPEPRILWSYEFLIQSIFNHHNLAKIIAIKKINKNLAWTRVWTSNLNPSSQVSQYKPPKPTITTTTTTTTISSSHHSTPWPIQTSPKILHLTQTNNHSIRSHLVPSQLTS